MNKIHKTAVIYDNVELGDNNEIGAYTVIGSPPEMKHSYVRTGKVIIGNSNVITNHVTIDGPYHEDVTKIGNDCFIMAKSHIGHDTLMENNVVVSALANLGGYCKYASFVNIGNGALIHQRLSIGESTMIGMGAVVLNNIPPFLTVAQNPAKILSINTVGLGKRGFSEKEVSGLSSFIKEYLKGDNPYPKNETERTFARFLSNHKNILFEVSVNSKTLII